MRLSGEQGWLLIFALVCLIDYFAPAGETLSDAVHRARRRHPSLVWGLITATVYHFLAGDHTTLGRYDTYKVPARVIRSRSKILAHHDARKEMI